MHQRYFNISDSSLRFTGDSYLKYRYLSEEDPMKIKVNFQMQTVQREAVVMYTSGTDSSLVEVRTQSVQCKERERLPFTSIPFTFRITQIIFICSLIKE